MSVKGKNTKFSEHGKSAKKYDIECYNCKRKGHYRKDCWFLEKNKHKRPENQNSKKDPSRNENENSLIGFEETSLTLTHTSAHQNKTMRLLDSGAFSHMSGNRELFTYVEDFENPVPVRIGDGRIVDGLGKGNVKILAFNGNVWVEKNIVDVLYVPDIPFNLFSMGSAFAKGLFLTSSNLKCTFYKNKEIVAIAERNNNKEIFRMKFKIKENIINLLHNVNINEKEVNKPKNDELKENKDNDSTLKLWHERLVHQNCEHVKQLLIRNNIKVKDIDFFCEACVYGKIHRLPFKMSESKSKQVGDLIHADVCGPMEIESLGGSCYLLLFKDDYSSYVIIYYLKNKSEVSKCFEGFILKKKNETGKIIKILRTDNGLEFINNKMSELTQKYGIKHERTVPYTPQQNGKAERENRTLVEAARTILIKSNLNKSLWVEAINTVSYVLNRTRKTNVENKTPYELWHDRKTNF